MSPHIITHSVTEIHSSHHFRTKQLALSSIKKKLGYIIGAKTLLSHAHHRGNHARVSRKKAVLLKAVIVQEAAVNELSRGGGGASIVSLSSRARHLNFNDTRGRRRCV